MTIWEPNYLYDKLAILEYFPINGFHSDIEMTNDVTWSFKYGLFS